MFLYHTIPYHTIVIILYYIIYHTMPYWDPYVCVVFWSPVLGFGWEAQKLQRSHIVLPLGLVATASVLVLWKHWQAPGTKFQSA